MDYKGVIQTSTESEGLNSLNFSIPGRCWHFDYRSGKDLRKGRPGLYFRVFHR